MIRLIKLVIVFSLFLSPVFAQENAKKPAFLRINKDEQGKYISFDTKIARYKKGEVEVDLVGVVHVGEAEYYQDLNQKFESYDAVLYELIADADFSVPKAEAGGSESIISKLQHTFKDILGLQFQLDQVDYKKSNFVHADMTPEAFMSSMAKRNESIWSILFKLFLNSKELSENNPQMSTEIIVLQMLLSPNKKLAFRKIMAAQFQDVDAFLEVFEGPEGSTIITGRNEVAIGVLKEQILKGKKKMAIFYGAGHMPDMEKRLFELGFAKESEQWLVAWQLR